MNDPPVKNDSAPHRQPEVGRSELVAPIDNRKIISFSDLAGGKKNVFIDFHGQQYRLRLTKSGRLVLTK